MLPVYIKSSYKGIVARMVSLPRDAEDLITIHSRNDYSPLSSLQPTSSTIELFYRRFLDWSSYGAYLLSYCGTTLFLLELMPVDLTELGNYYTPAFFDYSIGIKMGIYRDHLEESVQTGRLFICFAGGS